MENIIKGQEYENYIKYILPNSFLWKFIPYKHLVKSGLVHNLNEHRIDKKNNENTLQDIGVDLLQYIKETKEYIFIQCKNYSHNVGINDLSGFFFCLFQYGKKGKLFTTSSLTRNLKQNWINPNCEHFQLKLPQKKKNKTFKLRDYQLNAISNMKSHFLNHHRGILSMPCGTGKTIIASYFGQSYKNVIFFSPLIVSTKQAYERFNEYSNNSYKSREVYTNERDDIKSFVAENINDRIFISITYKSCDLIFDILETINDVDNTLIIVDEFHNLSRKCIIDKEDNFYKLFKTNYRILFMSATPKLFDIDYEEYEYITSNNKNYDNDRVYHNDIDEEEDEYVNYKNFFGEMCHSLSFNEALNKNIVCDYKLLLPSLSENHDYIVGEIRNDISVKLVDKYIEIKSNFIFNGLLQYGLRKTIVYLKDINEINSFIECLNNQSMYHGEEIIIENITYNTRDEERQDILNRFREEKDKRFIICSVRILDEAIDIPCCDSIYITTCLDNEIRVIQRLNRCTRKFSNKKFGYVFLWCDEYKQIIRCLENLREYDIDFTEKIKFLSSNVYKDNKEIVNYDKEICKKYIVGIKEYRMLNWKEKLSLIRNFILIKNRLPTCTYKDKDERILKQFLNTQEKNYVDKKFLMKIQHIRDEYENFKNEFSKYFISSEEKWIKKLNSLQKFIEINGIRPSAKTTDDGERKLYSWMKSQDRFYNDNQYIMKNEKIKKLYEEFISKYYYEVNDVECKWDQDLEKLRNYILKHQRKPSTDSKIEEEYKIAYWLKAQETRYKTHNYNMKKEQNRKKYEAFKLEFKDYLLSKEEIWDMKLQRLIDYVEQYKKKPQEHGNTELERDNGCWLRRQMRVYKTQDGIMSSIEYRRKFYEINQKYNFYELDMPDKEIQKEIPKSVVINIKKFNEKFNEFKEFIKTHNRKLLDVGNERTLYGFYKRCVENYLNNSSIFDDKYKFKEKQDFYEFCSQYDFLKTDFNVRDDIPKDIIRYVETFNKTFDEFKLFVSKENTKTTPKSERKLNRFYINYKNNYIKSKSIFQYDIKEKQEFYEFCNQYDFLRFNI